MVILGDGPCGSTKTTAIPQGIQHLASGETFKFLSKGLTGNAGRASSEYQSTHDSQVQHSSQPFLRTNSRPHGADITVRSLSYRLDFLVPPYCISKSTVPRHQHLFPPSLRGAGSGSTRSAYFVQDADGLSNTISTNQIGQFPLSPYLCDRPRSVGGFQTPSLSNHE